MKRYKIDIYIRRFKFRNKVNIEFNPQFKIKLEIILIKTNLHENPPPTLDRLSNEL